MRYNYLLPLFLIIFIACSENELNDLQIQDDQSISSLKGTWKVISYNDLESKKMITKDSSNSWGFDVIITIDDTVEPAQIKGRVTTNSIFGEFRYETARKIRISNLGTTYVNQPEWGNLFITLVSGSDLTFELNETHLRIYNKTNQLSALFEKE